MTYDDKIDAMREKEHKGFIHWETVSDYGIMTLQEIVEMRWSGRRYEQDKRNAERLEAYQAKRTTSDCWFVATRLRQRDTST